jgi:hypothetical protein
LHVAKEHIHRIELWALAALIAIAVAVFAYHRIQRRRASAG